MKLNLKNIKVAVEITSLCNLSCNMCPYVFMKREKKHMELETLKKIHKIIRENSLKVRWLHEMGEPLLYPHLKEALHLFPEAMLSTNGILLEGERAKVVSESNIRVVRICIDTLKEDAYKILRKGGNFQRVIKNTKEFLETTKDKKIEVQIQKMYSKITKDEKIKDFEIFFEKEKYKNLKIIEKTCEGLDTTDETNLHKKYAGCFQGGPFNWFVFLSNGDITHCCYDYEGVQKIGNIDEPFENVLQSPALEDLKKAFKCKNFDGFPACARCFKFRKETFTPPTFLFKFLKKVPFKNYFKKWFYKF
ncbi:MAG: radical SAM protein [Thermoanaerobaculia bacterium]